MAEQYNPELHTLNPRQLIEWCNTRCKDKGISHQKLSAETGVPEGTLDRILSGKNPEFRYSTVQPIIAYLIGFNKATPQPDEIKENQGEYFFNTIEGYKMIVDNKNHQIEEYAKTIRKLEEQLQFLKAENDNKKDIISSLQSHLKWMEGKMDKQN